MDITLNKVKQFTYFHSFNQSENVCYLSSMPIFISILPLQCICIYGLCRGVKVCLKGPMCQIKDQHYREENVVNSLSLQGLYILQ